MMRTATTILLTLLLTSCSEKNTTEPIDAYTYWSGQKPPKEIKLIRGSYWQSAHWTKEYIFYLKLRPTDEWWNEFIKQNNLKIEDQKWEPPHDAPNWFIVPQNATFYKPENSFYDSRFFRDNDTKECYIYDIQL